MKNLAILGNSGHGRTVADVALLEGWSRIEFYDDANSGFPDGVDIELMGNSAALVKNLSKYDGVFIGIGNCRTRMEKQREFKKEGVELVTIIHPECFVSSSVKLGSGVVVMAGAVINAGVVIGNGCIVNSGAIVEHDCNVAEAVHIAPNAVLLGNVDVGQCSWIGASSTVLQNVEIGSYVTVGAGAVVRSSVTDSQTVIGIPAKPLVYQSK